MLTMEKDVHAAPPAGTGPQKEQAVQRMFSSIARYYDLNNSVLSFGLHHRWKRQAIEGERRYSYGAEKINLFK